MQLSMVSILSLIIFILWMVTLLTETATMWFWSKIVKPKLLKYLVHGKDLRQIVILEIFGSWFVSASL